MQTEWSLLVVAAVLGLVTDYVQYTECQYANSPYGVYPPTSFGTTGGGGSLLPFPLFPTPCEVGYVTCEGPAGYIITNINVPGIPAIPATPATTPRPATPPATTPRPATPPATTPRPATPPATTPRPTVPAPTTARTTPRPATPQQPQPIQQQIVYMYPQRCNMWCRLIYRPQPVYQPQPCLLYNWLGFGGGFGFGGGGF